MVSPPSLTALVRPLCAVAYDIYLRAGLLEYMHEQYGAAVVFFEKAKPFAPPRNYAVVYGKIPTGIERLIDAAKTGKTLTPEIVRKGDPTAKTAMMLADIYHEGQDYQRSLDLCDRLLNAPAIMKKATREQCSYAHFRRARNHYLILDMALFNPDAALADYVAAVRAAPQAEWADKAMFYAGNIEWNKKNNPEAAISAWQLLIKNYPQSSEADRSAFFIGVTRYYTKQYAEAKKSLEKYAEDYPGSDFIDDARDLIDKCEKEISEQQGPAKKVRDRR